MAWGVTNAGHFNSWLLQGQVDEVTTSFDAAVNRGKWAVESGDVNCRTTERCGDYLIIKPVEKPNVLKLGRRLDHVNDDRRILWK